MITRKMAVDEIEHFLRARRNYYAHGIFSKGVDVLKDYDDIDVFNNMSKFEL